MPHLIGTLPHLPAQANREIEDLQSSPSIEKWYRIFHRININPASKGRHITPGPGFQAVQRRHGPLDSTPNSVPQFSDLDTIKRMSRNAASRVVKNYPTLSVGDRGVCGRTCKNVPKGAHRFRQLCAGHLRTAAPPPHATCGKTHVQACKLN